MSNQVCSSCVMDSSDEAIEFDDAGVCSWCRRWRELRHASSLDSKAARNRLDDIVATIKRRSGSREFDCVIGLSGGVDSTFVALRVAELGLRPLAVHVDTGWNSELAVSNIERIVKTLDLELFTHVVDWEEMRDLQLAFLRSGVANCDIPQDHAITTVLYRVAAHESVRTIVSGQNLATESILPSAWGYSNIDRRHIRSIQRRYGTRRLRKYPSFGLFQYGIWWPIICGIRMLPILDYTPYIKSEARRRIQQELGWRDYGGKHHESRFTRFFQAYYLPRKFGYDKRRAHLSSLIVSGQLDRTEAMIELQRPLYDEAELANTRFYMARKLRISEEELEQIIAGPRRTHRDFPSNEKLIARLQGIKSAIAGQAA